MKFFRKIGMFLIVGMIASCASSMKVTDISSNGKKAFLVRCNTPEACYEKAKSLCKEPVTKSTSQVAPDGWSGEGFKQTLLEISCKS